MTRTEIAELQELGLTEAQLEERRKKLSAQLAEDDNAAQPATRKEAMPDEPTETLHAPHGTRKPRSDRGQPRKVQAPSTPAGTLNEQQWARLSVLTESVTQAAVDRFRAAQRHDRATAELADYLASLKEGSK